MNRSPEAQEIAKHLLTHVLVRPERRMGAELINAAKNLARLGAINAALEALDWCSWTSSGVRLFESSSLSCGRC